MTTYTSFITAISGLVVSGVTRLTAPPASIGVPPVSFPMLPSGSNGPLVFANSGRVGGELPAYTCDLVFVYEAVGQGTQVQNYTGLLTLIDSVQAAIKTMVRPTAGPTTYTMRMDQILIGQAAYWALVVTFSGVG